MRGGMADFALQRSSVKKGHSRPDYSVARKIKYLLWITTRRNGFRHLCYGFHRPARYSWPWLELAVSNWTCSTNSLTICVARGAS